MTETALVRYCYSAAVIRSADGALLIVQRAATEDFQPNYWELPGGHAEDGESIQAALGELRKHYSKQVSGVLLTEIAKELVDHPTSDIEKLIAAA